MRIKQYFTTEGLIRLFALSSVLSGLAASVYFTDVLYYPLMGVSLIIGCTALMKIFLVDRTIYRQRYFGILFLFCVSYGVTILLNRHSGLFNNCGQLAYTACYFFILFCGFSQLTAEARRRIWILLCRVTLGFSLAVAVISVGMMLLNFSMEIPFRGTTIIIGFHQRNSGMQLAGISSGPSSLSYLCLVGIVSAWYLLWRPVRKFTWRWCVPTLLYLLALCAANAYAALIMALAFAVLYCFCRSFGGAQGGKLGKRTCKAALEMVLLCTLTVGCFYGVQKVEATAVNGISRAVYEYQLRQYQKEQPLEEQPLEEQPPEEQPPEEQPPEEQPPEEQPPEEPVEVSIVRDVKTSATGSRSAIWKEGIKLFLAHPLGVTNSNISVKIFYGVPDYEYRNLHNGYLTLLVSSGIVGFTLIMVFGILLLVRALKALYICQDPVRREIFCVAIALSAAILAGDLVNGCFVLWRGLLYPFLWLLLGSINSMTAAETSLDASAHDEAK